MKSEDTISKNDLTWSFFFFFKSEASCPWVIYFKIYLSSINVSQKLHIHWIFANQIILMLWIHIHFLSGWFLFSWTIKSLIEHLLCLGYCAECLQNVKLQYSQFYKGVVGSPCAWGNHGSGRVRHVAKSHRELKPGCKFSSLWLRSLNSKAKLKQSIYGYNWTPCTYIPTTIYIGQELHWLRGLSVSHAKRYSLDMSREIPMYLWIVFLIQTAYKFFSLENGLWR